MPTLRSLRPDASLEWGSFEANLARIHELAGEQWEIVYGGKHGAYRPSYHRFIAMEGAAMLHTLLVLDNSRVIVGYFLVMIAPSLHTREVVAADMGLYVQRQHRSLGLLKRMFDKVEGLLYAHGVARFEVSEPGTGPGDRLGLYLRRRGYAVARTVHELRMKR
jgi:GNAT superfamily N-acetyltransferase